MNGPSALTYRAITTALAALTIAALASCDGAPNRTPTGPGAAPLVPSVTRVEIVAPSTLAPGARTQLRAIAHRSDGTSEDITATASFFSQLSDVLQVSPGGIATALKIGESFVSANSGTVSSGGREVVVVPDGTFRVVGRVVEEDTPTLPVGGARVEVDGGVPPVSTDLDGRYRLYGVSGQARLRASKNGYITKELALSMTDHHTQNVPLALAGPRVDVAGTYQLTIEASPDCRGRIPDALLTRRYSAAVTQSEAAIQVVLTGATFGGEATPVIRPSGSTVIPGRVGQTGMVLPLVSPTHCDGSEPDTRIIEIVDGTTYLEMSGLIRLSAVGPGFSGTLGGDLIIRGDPQCGASAQAWCSSPSHRVALTR